MGSSPLAIRSGDHRHHLDTNCPNARIEDADVSPEGLRRFLAPENDTELLLQPLLRQVDTTDGDFLRGVLEGRLGHVRVIDKVPAALAKAHAVLWRYAPLALFEQALVPRVWQRHIQLKFDRLQDDALQLEHVRANRLKLVCTGQRAAALQTERRGEYGIELDGALLHFGCEEETGSCNILQNPRELHRRSHTYHLTVLVDPMGCNEFAVVRHRDSRGIHVSVNSGRIKETTTVNIHIAVSGL